MIEHRCVPTVETAYVGALRDELVSIPLGKLLPELSIATSVDESPLLEYTGEIDDSSWPREDNSCVERTA